MPLISRSCSTLSMSLTMARSILRSSRVSMMRLQCIPHHACSVDRAVCVHLGAELEPHALATPSNHNAVVNTSETLTDIFVLMGYDSCVKFVAFARLSSWNVRFMILISRCSLLFLHCGESSRSC
mmetsp:Transcript_7638/g.11326  ORF Transcript_7638/g.11326 Transcript_7638/m.11326 type:complete len:125 (+) Transcript_7638:1557-1931(+)